MEKNYTLNMDKIFAAYNALREFHNTPSGYDRKELDNLYETKSVMNLDEIEVFYDLVQFAYLQGRDDGYRAALD